MDTMNIQESNTKIHSFRDEPHSLLNFCDNIDLLVINGKNVSLRPSISMDTACELLRVENVNFNRIIDERRFSNITSFDATCKTNQNNTVELKNGKRKYPEEKIAS